MSNDPIARGIDSVAGRTGLTRDAVAILAIVAGIIILIWEDFLQVVLGVLLIVVGVVWLVGSRTGRQQAPPP